MYKRVRYMYVVTSGDYTVGVREAIVRGLGLNFNPS